MIPNLHFIMSQSTRTTLMRVQFKQQHLSNESNNTKSFFCFVLEPLHICVICNIFWIFLIKKTNKKKNLKKQ